jgi:predicted nucleotidyltransferase
MKKRMVIERESLVAFCRRHHIRRLSLFGSTLKGTSDSDSDVDLLVEFEPGYAPGFIRLAGMERELSDLAGGKKVDLRTPQDLSRYFRDEVLAAAEVQYAG